ncbi:MAG: class IV adenylate cyclase [bacterium]|nr:class IV adenylate cyclase [bacterium]
MTCRALTKVRGTFSIPTQQLNHLTTQLKTMSFLNIEIKARCSDPGMIKNILKQRNTIFKGEDHQIDTYFNCRHGRLKLREGNIEHHLIHYHREDEIGPKKSIVTLYQPEPNSSLKQILSDSLGILTIVDKKREIYFIDNIKFHIDQVIGLGSFIEIEAIDSSGTIGEEKLQSQCEEYIKLFQIKPADLIECSYSDLLLQKNKKNF